MEGPAPQPCPGEWEPRQQQPWGLGRRRPRLNTPSLQGVRGGELRTSWVCAQLTRNPSSEIATSSPFAALSRLSNSDILSKPPFVKLRTLSWDPTPAPALGLRLPAQQTPWQPGPVMGLPCAHLPPGGLASTTHSGAGVSRVQPAPQSPSVPVREPRLLWVPAFLREKACVVFSFC